MTREHLPEKVVRLLTSGRVLVERADARSALVVVEGDTDTYTVLITVHGASCPCASWKADCSHARAAELVGRRTAQTSERAA